jgi:cytosine/adenosine deaminase-related metal-dependent hydrolase
MTEAAAREAVATTLIHGAEAVWTGAAGAAMRAPAGTSIRLRGAVIEAIGPGLEPRPGERVVDARGCVVHPGSVNTHHHLFQSLLKGIPAGIDMGLVPWLGAVPVPYRRHFGVEEALRVAARVGLMELLLSGCTTVCDHQYHCWPGMPFDASAAVFEEAAALGLRFVLARGGQTMSRRFDGPEPPAETAPETLEQFMAGIERDAARFHEPGPMPMRRVASAITTPNWSCAPEHLVPMARQARALGLRLHSHLSETFDYVRWAREVHGMEPVHWCAEHEWVGEDVWFAHMVHLSDAEIALCAATGTGIAHCPQSNARLGSGIARIVEATRAGVPVGLAVDGAASNEAADMAAEQHAAWLVHRIDPRAGERHRADRDPKKAPAQPGGDAGAMTVEDVVHLASAGGARVLGLEGVGVLAPGRAADLAVYSLRDPRCFGLHDVGLAPVVGGGRLPLRALFCHGRLVVEHDTIPGLDLDALRHDAARLVRAMRESA